MNEEPQYTPDEEPSSIRILTTDKLIEYMRQHQGTQGCSALPFNLPEVQDELRRRVTECIL